MDHVARLVAKWNKERPDLDFAPVRIVGRLARILAYVDRALEEKFDEYGVSRATFDVLATLRREGPPYARSQRELMDNLLRTSGSVSVRIDAMERAGLVRRKQARRDRRSVEVTLTDEGKQLVDEIAPEHLKNEASLLAPLSAEERAALEKTLAKWLLWFESQAGEQGAIPRYGFALASTAESLRRRRAVGLPDVSGLLIVAVQTKSPAERAGLRRGDLLTAVGDVHGTSVTAIRQALAAPSPRRKSLVVIRGAEPLSFTMTAPASPAGRRRS